MPERFTDDARQVVVHASEQARRLGHGFIGGEHLLYGLASADGEVGPAALAPDPLVPRRWRRSRPRHITGQLPFTRRAKKCLKSSLGEAQAHSGGHPGAEHIALVLLAMDNGLPHRILSAIGAPAPRLRAEILDRCRKAA